MKLINKFSPLCSKMIRGTALGPSRLFLHDGFSLSLSHCMPVPAILGRALEVPTEGNGTSAAHILLGYALHVKVALPCKGWCKHVCCLQLEEERRQKSFTKGQKFLVRQYSAISKIRTSHALIDPFPILIIFFVARLYFFVQRWLIPCLCVWGVLNKFFFFCSGKLCVAHQLFDILSVILAKKTAVTFRDNAASLLYHIFPNKCQ